MDNSNCALSVSRFEPTCAPGLDSGVVFNRNGDALLLSCQQGLVRATRAAGCLLEPEPNDLVLVSVLPDGSAWVLSVLERRPPDCGIEYPATIRLPEQTVLAADALSLASRTLRCDAEKMTLKAADVAVEGTRVRVEASLLSLGGRLLMQTFGAMHTVAKRVSERVTHKNQWYAALRENVRGLVDRKAGRVRLESETGVRLRAGQVDIKARTVLDLDAEHIRLG